MNTRFGIRLITTTLLFALTTPQAIATTAPADSPASVQTAPPSAEVTGTWQNLTSTQDGFSVLMPEQPTQQSLDFPANSPMVHQFTTYLARLRRQSDVGSCRIIVVRLPATSQSSASDGEAALERTRNQILTGPNAYRLIREHSITLDGFPGREFEVDMSLPNTQPGGELILRTRMYIANQHLYQVMVAGSADLVHSAEADRFFNSFKLLAEDPANR